MAIDTIKVGDHRYLTDENGVQQPITITREAYTGCWEYVIGHVAIRDVKLSKFLPTSKDR